MKKIMSTFKVGLALFLAVFSTNLLPVATAYAAQPVDVCPLVPGIQTDLSDCVVADQTCDDITTPGLNGWTTKFDAGYPDTVGYTAPTGYLVDKYCVKAGSTQQGNDPIIVNVTPPSATATIDYPGKDSVSHYVVHLIAGPTQVAIPSPSPVDPCGPANASWTLPADTTELDWSLTAGVLSVQTKTGFVFTDQTTSKSFGLAQDSNVACPPQTVGIPTPTPNDPCGLANATWTLPADTTELDWSLTAGVLSVQTKAGFVFTDQTTSKNFGLAQDSGVLCPATAGTVTYNEACGTEDDTYTIPTTANVVYKVGGVTKAANTYAGTGTVTVVAEAAAGYQLTAPYTFTHTFTNVPCDEPCDDNCGEEDKKVYVCKYVGTPGVDERLKHGNDGLILVAENSINHNDWNGQVPGWFNDAHDRSFVLGYESDFPNPPSADDCPTNKKPNVQVLVPPCVDEGETTSVTIRVMNKNDFAITYKVEVEDTDHVGIQSQTAQIAANGQHDFVFTGYGVGNFDFTVFERSLAESNNAFLRPMFDAVPQPTYEWKEVFSHNFTIEECETEEPPVVDVCPNLPGNQTVVPEGYVKVGNECGQVGGDNDVCPNLPGSQTTVPVGSVKDSNGNCVIPAGGQGAILGTTLPAMLPATGGVSLPSPLFSLVAGFLTYLFVSRRNQRSEA